MCVRDIKPQLTFIINKENTDNFALLKRTLALPRKVVYSPYQFMQSWRGKTVDNLPVIDLPRTLNSWQVSYNNQLGLIETEA